MKNSSLNRVLSVGVVFCFCLSACSTARTNPLLSQEPDSRIEKKELALKLSQLGQLWDARHQPEKLNAFIEVASSLSQSEQRDFKWMTRLARAHYLRAEFFKSDTRQKIQDWEWGMNWAEKALTLIPEYRNRVINQKLPPEHAMTSVPASKIDALYWYAANLGKWAAASGTDAILKYKSRVKRIIDRIAEVAPELNHGAIYRYYGAYYALLPGYDRGELELSRKNFELAVTKYPNYFANRTLYSLLYAAKMKDAALYEKHLRWVVNANPKTNPEDLPEQLLEQKRAKELLK